MENAGIASSKFTIAEDNESMITVTVISTFLLGLLILPKLRKSAVESNVHPHLTIASSEVHMMAEFKERKNPDLLKTLNEKNSTNMGDR